MQKFISVHLGEDDSISKKQANSIRTANGRAQS